MIVTPIKTCRVEAGKITLTSLLDKYVSDMPEKSVLAITSKIVSLCEGSVVPIEETDKEVLIKQKSDYYLPAEFGKYGYHFTITHDSFTAAAGIDESNGNDNYILWPKDPQKTVNMVRSYLKDRFNIKNVGVIITDSTSAILRLGTIGTILGHSGFMAMHSYIGEPDLFGRPFSVSRSNIALGLAASSVLVMGEGSEKTPLAVISDVPFVTFQNRNPTSKELTGLRVRKEDDLYAPFLEAANWVKGCGLN